MSDRTLLDRRQFLTAAGAPLLLPASGRSQAENGNLPFSYFRGEPLRIGNEVQLLADDYVVEDRWKLTRRLGGVAKHLGNPVVVQNKPWEDDLGAYPCVLYDEKLDKYRMWYQCFSLSNYYARHLGPAYYIGYAESEDAFTWTKPMLAGFPFRRYQKTNIVTAGRNGTRASGAQVLLNPDLSDPKRRFMMVYIHWGQIDLAYSADGLHWEIVEKPLFRYHSDFPNHLVWVPEKRLWYLYVRPSIRPQGEPRSIPEGSRHTGRRLAVSTSPDLETWSEPRTVLYPDERDQPDYDNLYVFRRYGLFFALHSQMFQEKDRSETETHLAVSRDGLRWERTWDRQPLIPRGPEGSYDHGQVEPGTSPPLEVGDDLLIYYYASPAGQSEPVTVETSVAVARLRKDRFVGQWADTLTGYLVTRQFRLEGSRLEVNCVSNLAPYTQRDWGIRVEVVESPDYQTRETRWERKVPGFTLEDCDIVRKDALAHTVTWRGNADLGALKGKAVYLRFEMKKAGLYSFRIAP
jgi:predicted GH43/DUF377 family glycosyl hydrolase